jgi:two-component system, OmpR family, response regulator
MPSILVVDDQPDIRDLLLTLLKVRKYEVELAASGCLALTYLNACNELPDLILLDVQMPEMDGWVTLEQIRHRFGEFGPPVVMCTVKGHANDLLRGWTLGCDGYIWKPFDLKVLVEQIESVLSRTQPERKGTRRNAISEAQLLKWPLQQDS